MIQIESGDRTKETKWTSWKSENSFPSDDNSMYCLSEDDWGKGNWKNWSKIKTRWAVEPSWHLLVQTQ